MPFSVCEKVKSASWVAYAGWVLGGLSSDKCIAQMSTQKDAINLAAKLNLKAGDVRAAWNNSKQHIDDFAVVYTTDDKYKDRRQYYVVETQ